MERIESLKAEKNRLANLKQNTDSPKLDNRGRTDEIVAHKLGIGGKDTYRKEKYIVDNKNSLTPEDFAEWDEGKQNSNRICLSLCVRNICGSYMRLVYTGKCVMPECREVHNGVVKCYPIGTIF